MAVNVGVGVSVGGTAVAVGVAVGVGVAPVLLIVKLSITSPCVQSMSFVPPPGGPQRKTPWMLLALKVNFRTPWRM